MDAITLVDTEVKFEERAADVAPTQVLRELNSFELALVGGGTANVVFA